MEPAEKRARSLQGGTHAQSRRELRRHRHRRRRERSGDGGLFAKGGLQDRDLRAARRVGHVLLDGGSSLPGREAQHACLAADAAFGPSYVDLELERFGLELLRAPGARYGYFYPFRDGNAVLFSGCDAGDTYEAWKRISPKDAETFRRVVNFYAQIREFMPDPAGGAKPTDESFLQFLDLCDQIPVLPKDWIWMTGVEFVDALFENEQIKVAALSYPATSGLDGIASRIIGPLAVLNFLTIFSADGGYTARGGSHNLTHALVRCFVHHGGRNLYNCPVEKIIIENNQAKGVFLGKSATYSEGEFRASKAVISDVSAKPTFFNLVGEEHLPASARAQLKRFDYRGSSLFTNYYVLNERPDFACAEKFPEVNDTFVYNFGAETMDDVGRLIDYCMIRNRPPDPPVVWGAAFNYCIADPTQAPPGHYTLLTWAMVPYELRPMGGPQVWTISANRCRQGRGRIRAISAEPQARQGRALRQHALRLCAAQPRLRREHASERCGDRIADVELEAFRGLQRAQDADRQSLHQPVGSGRQLHQSRRRLAAANEVLADLGVARPEWWCGTPFQGARELLRRQGIEQRFTVD